MVFIDCFSTIQFLHSFALLQEGEQQSSQNDEDDIIKFTARRSLSVTSLSDGSKSNFTNGRTGSWSDLAKDSGLLYVGRDEGQEACSASSHTVITTGRSCC